MNPACTTLLLNRWLKLLQKTETTAQQQQTLLEALLKRYSAQGRVYHNTNHLCEIFTLLDEFAHLLTEPDAANWAVFYHDAVYNPLRKDNEQRSAQLALKVMQNLNLPPQTTTLTQELILATQNHIAPQPNVNIYLFLDADLAILGAEPEKYDRYARAIRTEYRLVPDILYQPGRKRVLQHLLAKPALYYMPQMQARFEQQARLNMQRELETL
ncbi:hypothetical protein C7N43_00475 [Sphingobacteriales bacterium UPWRP_1]|nr:hypothetical protein BVG80_15405 [Sphingobacteriales bacterium TSM_CSM]PSJ79134.1 hypothetical protein C7N43_00475 [Sphingobacteriales bacterium UPWRP_1]